MRIFDVNPVINWPRCQVTLAEPFRGDETDMVGRMKAMQEWSDLHCEGDYIILLGVVAFEREADALIFKLKFG